MQQHQEKHGTLSGSHKVTWDQIVQLPPPVSKGRFHKPVHHSDLIDALKINLQAYGLEVLREEYALKTEGAKLFGVFDLLKPNHLDFSNGDKGLAMGFRSGNDQSMPISLVGGARVFVCDNMALSGNMIVLKKKHTTHLNLMDEIRYGLDKLLTQYKTLDESIARLQSETLDVQKAKEKIYDAFVNEGVLPMRYLPEVDHWYFHTPQEAIDCQARTAWGLHNAFTRTLKTVESPSRQFEATVELGRVFNMG